ncbi:MAG: SH3 domain-containing protein [Lachnospiraceae bacterium]|nr:SH3 domain-containing protein [Lachnospiraceae bacterium]
METETASDTVPVSSGTAYTSDVPAPSVPKEVDTDVIAYRTFFGKSMQIGVAVLNYRTIAAEGSGLYDLSSRDIFTHERVLRMIESYSLDPFVLLDGHSFSAEEKESLKQYRNTDALRKADLSQPVEVRLAVLTQNADLRSFPTDRIGLSAGMDIHFDLFQETKLLYGSCVKVLWQTSDLQWYFVQGENYYGWIRYTDLAFCSETDFETFFCPDQFIVTLSHEGTKPWHRMGVVLPYREIPVSSDRVERVVLCPVRKEDGTLEVRTDRISSEESTSDQYSDGFLPFSNDAFRKLMETMLDAPYGWGDMDNEGKMAYDCSSTLNSVLKCFGIYMPRNSSQYRYSGAEVIDMTGLSAGEKFRLLEEHPASALMAPGHVMFNDGLYSGSSSEPDESGKHSIIHNAAVFGVSQQTSDDTAEIVRFECYHCVRSQLEDIYGSDYTVPYIGKIALLLDFSSAESPLAKMN